MFDYIANLISLMRFEVFQHVPDVEKVPQFLKMMRIPHTDALPFKVIEMHIQQNSFCNFKRFLKQLKRFRSLHRLSQDKDYEMIMNIYYAEQDPELSKNILKSLLEFSFTEPNSYTVWGHVTNLLYSATCRQDKIAALFLLCTN
jgi:hypothetical protein